MRRPPLVAGIPITHPERIIYPALGVTKLDVARYYAAVADRIVPHVAGRPLTLVLCPNGLPGGCSYMRHRAAWGPTALRRVRIKEKTKTGEYLIADNVRSVIGLVQMTVLEIHTWNARDDDIERPDRMMWDLDPGGRVTWSQVVAAAYQVRAVLQVLGLQSWVKTTGGRGLHVVAPIRRTRDWSDCLRFAKAIAQSLERSAPTTYTTQFQKQGRQAKILIDYLRNNRTNTSIAASSTRARAGATVSVPIAWTDLTARLNPATFTVLSVPKRLHKQQRDPWAEYWKCRQRLTAAMIRAVESVG
jgi:bifunctional non-homologous end joining protein LigD